MDNLIAHSIFRLEVLPPFYHLWMYEKFKDLRLQEAELVLPGRVDLVNYLNNDLMPLVDENVIEWFNQCEQSYAPTSKYTEYFLMHIHFQFLIYIVWMMCQVNWSDTIEKIASRLVEKDIG